MGLIEMLGIKPEEITEAINTAKSLADRLRRIEEEQKETNRLLTDILEASKKKGARR